MSSSEITTIHDAAAEAKKSRRMLSQAVVIGAVVVIVSVLSNVVTITGRNDEAKANGKTLEAVEAQLMKAQKQIETAAADRDVKAEVALCVTRYTYVIQGANADLLAAVSDLVVIISTTVPGPERTAAIGTNVAVVKDAVIAYRRTVAARLKYDVDGSPLPCPLEPGAGG